MFLQLLLFLLLLMVFSSENFGFSPPYAVMAGIGPVLVSYKNIRVFNKMIRCILIVIIQGIV